MLHVHIRPGVFPTAACVQQKNPACKATQGMSSLAPRLVESLSQPFLGLVLPTCLYSHDVCQPVYKKNHQCIHLCTGANTCITHMYVFVPMHTYVLLSLYCLFASCGRLGNPYPSGTWPAQPTTTGQRGRSRSVGGRWSRRLGRSICANDDLATPSPGTQVHIYVYICILCKYAPWILHM